MALEDYGALLRSGQASVPDYAAQEARRQLLGLQQGALRLQMAEAQKQIDEEDAFETDLAGVMTNPTAESYAQLIAKHPKFAQQVKSSWDVLDKSRQKSDFQAMSEVYSAAGNGRHDLAAALLRRRLEADKAAGEPEDPHDQAILDAMESDDPIQQKAAMGMLGVTLATIAGPEKFGETLGKLTEGKNRKLREIDGILIDEETMQPVAQSPYARIIPGPNGAFYEQPRVGGIPILGAGQAEGGGQASGAGGAVAPAVAAPPATPTAPLDILAAANIGGQFGRVTSTKRTPERNRDVGGVKNSYHLSGRAIDIARKPGVTHSQIEAAYKAAGYQIIESLDEGDHSHFAFGKGPANGLPQVKAKQQWDKLPKGARYIAPDGSVRVKG